ncbi:MAG: serine hydrolase [Bacteroidota bacterium]
MKSKHLLLFLFAALFFFNSCHVGRFFYWNFADSKDYKKFHSLPLAASDKPFHFFDRTDGKQLSLNIKTDSTHTIPFEKLLTNNKTVGFLILRNDTILYEKYFLGRNAESYNPSFSVSKSYVSALIGIAIGEGKIGSAKDPITKYLPELTQDFFKSVTIEHLLNMESGLYFNESYTNPFGGVAKFYYGRNLNKYVKKLSYECPPGEKYDYKSANTQLLAMILERATGQKLSSYLEEKIWKPCGMEYDASWSVDSKKHKTVKAFCCLNARARDFAKFGRLYLKKGNWNGKQIIPESWVNETTALPKPGKTFWYHYQWRVGNQGDYFAAGVLGQYIYVYPAKNIIMVRMGKKSGHIGWFSFFRKVAEQL